MSAYMEKALREAKRHTNWVDQNEGWEHAVQRFVAALYDDARFRAELDGSPSGSPGRLSRGCSVRWC